MKRTVLAAAFLAVAVSQGLAGTDKVSLNTTGYEWLGYDRDHKRAFVGMLHIVLNVNKGRYDAEEVIRALDEFYGGAIEGAKADPLHVDEDKFLRIRCVDVIRNKMDCRIEIKKGRQDKANGRSAKEQPVKEPS